MSPSTFQVRLSEERQCLAQGHTVEEVERCARPRGCHQPIPQKVCPLPWVPHSPSGQRYPLAEAAQRHTLRRELLRATRESCLRLGAGLALPDPRSQVTGQHHWGVQFPGVLFHLQPGSSQLGKTVTWASWAPPSVWAREIIVRVAPSRALRA